MDGITPRTRAEEVDMNDSPQITFCIRKACAENELTAAVNAVFEKYALPHFSRVDILRAILVDEQQKAYHELANDSESVLNSTVGHFTAELAKVASEAEAEKRELIRAFEEGSVNDGDTAEEERRERCLQ